MAVGGGPGGGGGGGGGGLPVVGGGWVWFGPMPVTWPLPPSKTTSEQLKKFSWLSERTHWM